MQGMGGEGEKIGKVSGWFYLRREELLINKASRTVGASSSVTRRVLVEITTYMYI